MPSNEVVRNPIRVAIVRGRHLNHWEMQNFEPLMPEIQLTAFASRNHLYPTESLDFRIISLGEPDSRLRWLPKGRYRISRRLWGALGPDHLFGLENALSSFDIIHAADTHFDFTYQATVAKLRHGSKLVITCWETIPFQGAADGDLYERKLFIQRHTDMFVAMSGRAREALLSEGVDAERIRTVHPGVNLKNFSLAGSKQEQTPFVKRRGDSMRVLYVGRIVPEKGIREFLLAIALVKANQAIGNRIEAVIVGRGQHGLMRRIVQALDLGDTVTEIEQVAYSLMPSLFHSSDVFVLPSLPTPSWEEQFGMVLAEAMACGIAIVTTASGSIPEVVGDAAKLVPPYNHRALAAAIEELLLDDVSRADLGSKGVERAQSRFDSARFARELRAIYEEVMCLP